MSQFESTCLWLVHDAWEYQQGVVLYTESIGLFHFQFYNWTYSIKCYQQLNLPYALWSTIKLDLQYLHTIVYCLLMQFSYDCPWERIDSKCVRLKFVFWEQRGKESKWNLLPQPKKCYFYSPFYSIWPTMTWLDSPNILHCTERA